MQLMLLQLGEAVGACREGSMRCFPARFPPFAAAPAPPVLARAASRIREMMLLKIKPNVILLLGSSRASSAPRLLGGAISGCAGTEGAWLGVLGAEQRAQDQP